MFIDAFFYDELCRLPIVGVLHQHPYDSTIKHLFNRYVYIIIFSERKVNSVLCQEERSRCVPFYTIRVFRTQLEALGAKIVSLFSHFAFSRTQNAAAVQRNCVPFSHFAFSRTQIKPPCSKYCVPILAFCVFRTQNAATNSESVSLFSYFAFFGHKRRQCTTKTVSLLSHFSFFGHDRTQKVPFHNK